MLIYIVCLLIIIIIILVILRKILPKNNIIDKFYQNLSTIFDSDEVKESYIEYQSGKKKNKGGSSIFSRSGRGKSDRAIQDMNSPKTFKQLWKDRKGDFLGGPCPKGFKTRKKKDGLTDQEKETIQKMKNKIATKKAFKSLAGPGAKKERKNLKKRIEEEQKLNEKAIREKQDESSQLLDDRIESDAKFLKDKEKDDYKILSQANKLDLMNAEQHNEFVRDAANNYWISRGGSASDPNSVRNFSTARIPTEVLNWDGTEDFLFRKEEA